jgi:hypothetical protein
MSKNTEKKVIEETRRGHSDIHSLTGNLVKGKGKNSKHKKNSYSEKDVRNPFVALLIIAGAFGVIVLLAFIISLLQR